MRNTLNILILLLTFSVQGQISESWNLNIDTYTHNSSNYASKHPPIEIAEFSNNDKVILSQNGTLIKIDSKGEIIWRKEISTCARQRIIVDIKDNIIFSCGSEITKFDLNGEIVWNIDFASSFSKKYMTFDAITYDQDKIHLAGHFFHSKYICQLSIDSNGKVLWKKKFKQDVDYEFSFLPPKQIILYDNRIYILAHHYSNSKSFLYSSNLFGKKRKELQIDYKIIKLKLRDNSLFTLGHLNNLKDKLIFAKLDINLNLLEKSEFELPRNFDYKKAIRSLASTKPPTKEEFDKKYITAYNVNDFEFIDDKNILVVGSSYGKPWLTNVNLNKEIVWNWDKEDSRYFNFNNDYSKHYFSLYSIDQIGTHFLISGICEEEDYKESRLKKYVNIFIREIGIEK
jgi:hypothetical protein